ncbi:hypothetical protein J7J84_07435 [bacterium]|nr:hypothetical protein [bacterium]
MRVEGKKGFVTKASQGLGPPLALHYQKDFTYDKAGNPPSLKLRRASRLRAVNFYPPSRGTRDRRDNSYNYDAMGRLTAIQDTGRTFTAAVTNDWNGNITEVAERWGGGNPTVSTFSYDNENRLTELSIGNSGFSADHTYDGFNRLIKTDATVLGSTTNYEHTYAGKKHLGNIDVTNQQQPVNGKVWRWEGGAGAVDNAPIESPQRSSASNTQYYMLNDERTIEKRSYQVGGVTAGDVNDDSRYAEWQHVNGAIVPTRVAIGIPSELFNAYNITLDADRASSAATNYALQLGATDLEYEVTRVKSPVIGRDMNPMGRGDGTYYANGGNYADSANVVISGAKPVFTGEAATGFGSGVNNTYSPEECQKLRNEQLRRLEEDPACKKEIGLDPTVCCITECGVGLPDGKEKDRLRRSCDCCCCLAKGCPPCLYPLPPECILCCVGGYIGPGGVACECTDTSQGDPCDKEPGWDCDKIRERCNYVRTLGLLQYTWCEDQMWNQEKFGKVWVELFRQRCNAGKRDAAKDFKEKGCKKLETVGGPSFMPPPEDLGSYCLAVARGFCYDRELCSHEEECCPPSREDKP